MNGPSVVGAISEPSICTDNAAAIATRLPEYLVRHTPKILLNPLRREPEAQSLKRCLYCDLNLSFLDF